MPDWSTSERAIAPLGRGEGAAWCRTGSSGSSSRFCWAWLNGEDAHRNMMKTITKAGQFFWNRFITPHRMSHSEKPEATKTIVLQRAEQLLRAFIEEVFGVTTRQRRLIFCEARILLAKLWISVLSMLHATRVSPALVSITCIHA
jgi:hypothetical protein